MTDLSEAMGQMFGALFSVAMIVLPVVVLYLIIRRAVSGGFRDANESGVEQHHRTPREILDERYARGVDRQGRVRTGAPGSRNGVGDTLCVGALLKNAFLW